MSFQCSVDVISVFRNCFLVFLSQPQGKRSSLIDAKCYFDKVTAE